MSKRPFSLKQYHAVKAKLKRQGRWEERSAERRNKDTLKPDKKKQRTNPRTQRTIDEYIAEPSEAEPGPSSEPSGKPMFNNGKPQSSYFFDEDSSNSCELIAREVSESLKDSVEDELEGQGLLCFEGIPDSPISVLHEGGNIPRETREIERAFRNFEVSSGTKERIRTAGIPEIAGTVRNNTLMVVRNKPCMFWDEFNDLEEFRMINDSLGSYFQTFNSLAVVIRCLPDDCTTTIDIFDKLRSCIDTPYILICEKSDEGVLHWHMIWLTSKRSDNAKRLLQKGLSDVPGNLSISCQQTRSFKHLIRYILKNPITVVIDNSDALIKHVVQIMRELETPIEAKEEIGLSGIPNQMVKDILKAMSTYKKYTYEELVFYAPDVMQKYLHKPNLESIVSNCKLFLHRPNDTSLTHTRIMNELIEPVDLFPIYVWLSYQGVIPENFIGDFWNVIFKLSDKKNVLAIQGPSNTGKTTFIRPLADIYNWGEIVHGGQFMFQNCINKELLFWEEPLIGSDYTEVCKKVFEGMTTQVNIKFKAPQTLYRTPVVITTNKDVWHYSDCDEEAFRNRMFLYYFTETMTNGFDLNRLESRINKLYRGYCKWLERISYYFTGCEPDCTAGIESSTAEGVSYNCRFHRDIRQCSSIDNKLRDNAGSERSGHNPDTEGVNDRGRSRSNRSKSQQRTERSRSPINDSTTVDDSQYGTRATTGNTTGRRSDSEEGFTIYRQLGEPKLRESNRLGGEPRLLGGGDTYDNRGTGRGVKNLRGYIKQLRDLYRGYGQVEEIFRQGTISLQSGVDWTLYDSLEAAKGEALIRGITGNPTKEQWLGLIKLGFLCAECDNLL